VIVSALFVLSVASVDARISRDRSKIREFRSAHACPATGWAGGRCDGWQVDHIIPLCAGGPDELENLQWISYEDHKWKTFVDVRECRKLQKNASIPAS